VYKGVRIKLSTLEKMVLNPYMAVCPANFLIADNGVNTRSVYALIKRYFLNASKL